ncbi:Fur family transcriptional regulator [Nocardioides sp. InS609-2]|uniref:Fur family transcriptional regulator n=1 Tax=Nocardioides sp. InS609-2 TaxID=2760705 RepID=UPI0020BD72CA|nr:Fur family transcriptional regulator [Nocardioides sp. InS609-2]
MPQPTPHVPPDVLLREHGLRITSPRVAVLTALAEAPHSGADAVIRAVPQTAETSTQAGNDVLHTHADRGLVRRIQPTGSVARNELRTDNNQPHVVCRSCGAVEDVDCATGQPRCLVASDDTGFVIDEAEVTWWGPCPACRNQNAPAHPTPGVTHA